MRHLFVTLLLPLLAACATSVGTSDVSTISDDVVATCEAQCDSLGLEFDGVSLSKRSVDCVCEPD